ncbi:MAG: class I SAM-dependent methyltransferase [bacterium]|jgi:SAM-dependent methyltransferase|nr:class I SAM-dependent methyltransferase [candidate division KSB1 bacterium]MDH7561178.1 class I SAM-dependent methyltransferase [bacterium]
MPRRETRTYSQLAEIYDYVMRHVDYQLWAEHVDLLLARAGVQRGKLLDLACGTGSLSWHLRRLGWEPALCDLSWHMVRQAQSKFRQGGAHAPMWVTDMCQVATRRRFSAVVCIYDSINYLLSAEDWLATLDRVADCLEEEGAFVFDVCTAHNSRRNFRNFRDRESGPGFSYLRRSRYLEHEGVQINDFEIELASAPGVVFKELHRQRIYSLAEVEAMIQHSRLCLVGSYCDFTLTPGTEQCERVHYVLRRRASGEMRPSPGSEEQG